jgi:plastocyanin
MRTFLPCMRRAMLIGALLLAGLPQQPIAASAAESIPVAVDIQLFAFGPATQQVPAGTTVVWTNHDSIVHSVTHGIPEEPGAAFDSGLFDQDQTFSLTFTDPGDYPYFCTRHSFMRGVISVVPS